MIRDSQEELPSVPTEVQAKPGKQSRWVTKAQPKPSLTCRIRESVVFHCEQRSDTISLIHTNAESYLHTHIQISVWKTKTVLI